jgi:glutamate mutase epsilon subunit
VAAAAVTIIMVITGMITDGQKAATQIPQTATADNKLVEMRQMYDARMDQAIIDLENVMQNVDDSTRMQINAVIDGLLNTGDVFAELAPLPEEKQMAIAEQIYDNKLRTLELLTDKLNK